MRAFAGAGIGLVALAAGRRFRDWGATKRECLTRFPGDEMIAEPGDVTTRAVTIDAPAEEVWRWLVQIGQDRGGMYSYDGIENMLGLRVHSTDEIHDEWQQLRVGDSVRLVRPGWMGMRDGLALPVARIDPGRSIVLRQQPPDSQWDAVWSFHVVPLTSRRCRLVSRSRSARPARPARVAALVMDPVTMLMTRRMLLGIKERAERSAESAPAAESGAAS
jgi:hypothetical protein